MINLKLLNSFLFFFIFLFFNNFSFSNEPVDIWDIKNNNEGEPKDNIEETELLNIDSNENIINSNQIIFADDNLILSSINLIGLYDPQENNLNIDMWKYSDGDQLKNLIKKIFNKELSDDAMNILEIALLTNSYFPTNKITNEEFIEIKNNFLLKKKDFKLMKTYLLVNQNAPNIDKLIENYINYYLINNELNKSCELFDNIVVSNFNDYLDKFKIYCLINNKKLDDAQLIYDLKVELGFKDPLFDKNFNYLMGYNSTYTANISNKSVLDFHLSRLASKEFNFIPDENTPDFIWKYLSSRNLLQKIDEVNLDDDEKVKTIEQATHQKNYSEKDLLNLYKRYNFSLEQLMSVNEIYNKIPSVKGRALLYQRLLLTYDTRARLNLAEKLKKSFTKDEIENAFNFELSEILKVMNKNNIPSEFTTFYNDNLIPDETSPKNIKFNNKIIHQSKLINYFKNSTNLDKTSKDLNDILKKTKSNKNYIFSNKDKMLLDSLRYDEVSIQKKYLGLYEENPNVPVDIQVLINNEDVGMVLLRLVEIIGQDKIEDLGTETLYFIITALNQINLDTIRNQILLKILPNRA
ncbi:MAG: hypothetical protein CBE49_001380 [Rickettsiales bacterium TMED289]|nr:MAG: hypothetical protein CBE49_001380 [Rickettsiales bacterium TMED289]|tara:strand:+ start:1008 stop:2744 length:1737 start_codon:yes stop_codon:yes gene_type:complete